MRRRKKQFHLRTVFFFEFKLQQIDFFSQSYLNEHCTFFGHVFLDTDSAQQQNNEVTTGKLQQYALQICLR